MGIPAGARPPSSLTGLPHYSTLLLVITISLLLLAGVEAREKCVLVRGSVTCGVALFHQFEAHVELYDRDGFPLLGDWANPDDFMGNTTVEVDGTFMVSGCAEDPNWVWIDNVPEPYLRIVHNCLDSHDYVDEYGRESPRPLVMPHEKHEIIKFQPFSTFQPEVYYVGQIDLDRVPDTLVVEKRIEWWAKRSGTGNVEDGDYGDDDADGEGPYHQEGEKKEDEVEGKPRLPDEDCGHGEGNEVYYRR